MRVFAIASLMVTSILLFACSDNGSGALDQGVLQVFLTDKPVELKSVSVTISEIEVHQTGSNWKPFTQTTKSVDLLTLKGSQSLLAMGDLSDGMYTGFRLHVDSGFIIDNNGAKCELTVPSDKIEVPVVFEIQKGKVTKVLLDFNAEQSVQVTRAGESNRCLLRPVITPVNVSND